MRKKLIYTDICERKCSSVGTLVEEVHVSQMIRKKYLSESFPRFSLWLLSDFFYSAPNYTFKEQWKEKSRQVQGQLWNIPSAVVKRIWSKSEERLKK